MDLTDEELLEHISEATTMSKGMDEYDGRKSCAITTAKRLACFLGDEHIKDKGLNCQYIIARRPENQPTSERAIPVSIFSADPAVARSWLRKWCGGDIGSSKQTCMMDVVSPWLLCCCNMVHAFHAALAAMIDKPQLLKSNQSSFMHLVIPCVTHTPLLFCL